MTLKTQLTAFFAKVQTDPRIGSSHISLYLTILSISQLQGETTTISAFSKTVMKLAKISSSATYVRLIGDLCAGRYIRFEPSFYSKQPSKIHILELI